MPQRHPRTTGRLRLALTGQSLVRATEIGQPSGGTRLPPDQRQDARGVGSPLSLEHLAAIHGGIGGIKEKLHLPLYDAL